ncbi:MAG: UDP-N-acetylenolpyruvoylglucosamine reductase [Gammaproteobacteria bacterium]|nr:MAG: UDP-N-acetylenolpyruvoylglucosamine reductase [Gammaproteobacteria bacterium]
MSKKAYNCYYNELLSKHTAWKVGGPADIFFTPQNRDDLTNFLKSNHGKQITWLGNGTNVLVRDGGIRGAVISTKKSIDKINMETKNSCRVEAGASCMDLALFAEKNQLGPAAFFSGIPGSIGGALTMNAGSFGMETWDLVKEVEVINEKGDISFLEKESFEIAYRAVTFPFRLWFLSCSMFLSSDEETTKDNLIELRNQRIKTQPLSEDTCGSVFKNPPGNYAGALIEGSGLKGFKIGSASISEKHANFIVNQGGATAGDIENLINHTRQVVKKNYDIDLQLEVRIMGEKQ